MPCSSTPNGTFYPHGDVVYEIIHAPRQEIHTVGRVFGRGRLDREVKLGTFLLSTPLRPTIIMPGSNVASTFLLRWICA